jgi:hypothetical protein
MRDENDDVICFIYTDLYYLDTLNKIKRINLSISILVRHVIGEIHALLIHRIEYDFEREYHII